MWELGVGDGGGTGELVEGVTSRKPSNVNTS